MKVLVIDDEAQLRTFLQKELALHRCVVEAVASGKDGIARARINDYDAIILDFYIGDTHGDKVARAIKAQKPSLPIIVLSAEHATTTKVDMLGSCDDYLIKPFCVSELVARLHAVLRRGNVVRQEVLVEGPLRLDSRRYSVELDGSPLVFRNKEFALLEYLMRHRDMVLSRETILSHVWDMNADPFTNTVDTHIRLLRKKLEAPRRTFIHTVPKRGYRFSFVA